MCGVVMILCVRPEKILSEMAEQEGTRVRVFIPGGGQRRKNFISGQLFLQRKKPAPGQRAYTHVCNARPELITRRRRD